MRPTRQKQKMAANDAHLEENQNEDDVADIPPEDYHFVEHSHSTHVLTGFTELRQSGLMCDVILCVDGQDFPCHRALLASFSTYFRAMFSGELAESRQERVSLNGIESSILSLLVDFAYTSEIMITKTNVQSLLSAANLLGVLAVRDACCRFMQRHMDATNCLGIHCFAEAHACTPLQELSKTFVLKHFNHVSTTEDFFNLPCSKIVEFISDDYLCVEQEEEVFEAVMRWFDMDPEKRQLDIEKAFEHIRLPLMSVYFLHDCVESRSGIMQFAKCRRLVEEAKNYHLLQDRRAELYSPRTRPRRSTGTCEVIIAVGGEDDKVVLRSVETFDPHTSQWRTLACLPFAVSKHGLVVSGSSILYLAGGEFPDGSASKDVWRYDPSCDNWAQVSPMNYPRSELGVAAVDGYIYAVGGWEGSARLDSVERYSPSTNTWTFVSPMKMALTSPAVVAHEGKLFVMGGAVLEDGDGIDLVQCYDTRTDQWTQLQPMTIARSGSAAVVLNGYIYVIGGWHASTENTNKVERFNIARSEWEIRAPMNERRYRPGLASIDGKIYVLGGEEGWDRYHDTIESYNEEQDFWEIIGEMPTSRSWLSCVALQLKEVREKIEDSCPEPPPPPPP